MCRHCGCLNPNGPDLDSVCSNTGLRKKKDCSLPACECLTCRLARGEERPDQGDQMKVTNEMLTAAMQKAVAIEIFPKHVDTDTYLENWESMKLVLEAALGCHVGCECLLYTDPDKSCQALKDHEYEKRTGKSAKDKPKGES